MAKKWLTGEQPASDALDNQINRINKMLVSAAKTLGTSSELYKAYEAQVSKLTAYAVTHGGKTHTLLRQNKEGVIQITRGSMARGKVPGGTNSLLLSESDRAANIQRILNEFDLLSKKRSVKSEKKRIESIIKDAAVKKGKPIKGKITGPQLQAAATKLASAHNRMENILDYLYAHEQAIEAQKQNVGVQNLSADARYENWHIKRGLNVARKKGQKRTYAELQAIARHAAAVRRYNIEHGIPDIGGNFDIEDIQ